MQISYIQLLCHNCWSKNRVIYSSITCIINKIFIEAERKVKWVKRIKGNWKAVYDHRAYVKDRASRKNKRGKQWFIYQCADKTQKNCNARMTIGKVSILWQMFQELSPGYADYVFKIAHYSKSPYLVQKYITVKNMYHLLWTDNEEHFLVFYWHYKPSLLDLKNLFSGHNVLLFCAKDFVYLMKTDHFLTKKCSFLLAEFEFVFHTW